MSKSYESLTKESAITARRGCFMIMERNISIFGSALGSGMGSAAISANTSCENFWDNGQVAAFDIVKAGRSFLGGITPAELASKRR